MSETKISFLRRLYTSDFDFEFIKRRKIWYSFSAVLIVISLLALIFRGLNLGIEFKGGSVFTTQVPVASSTVDDFSTALQKSGVSELEYQVRTVGSNTVRIQTRSLDNEETVKVRSAIASQAKTTSENVAYSQTGPSWGQQITHKALMALVIFLVLVGVLIWIYFRNWKMSVSALAALLHDLIVTVGLYALAGFSVTPATVIAVLTILGYSLYDTVVVFDMVRENTADIKNKPYSYSHATNLAINQVLVRSINTTIIAVLPVTAILLASIFVLGGEGPLADLGLAMLIGMISGAYSSIFLASPMLAQFRELEPDMVRHRRNLAKAEKRKKAKVEAKIVTSEQEKVATDLSTDSQFVTSNESKLTGRPVHGERQQRIKQSRSDRKRK